MKLISIITALSWISFSAHSQQLTNQYERITVSAARHDTSALDVSGNIAWLDETELENISHEHVNQALVRIPGAWISRGNGQEHLTALRSPVLTGAGACGAFFMAQDGISLRAPGFCNTNQLFDSNTEQAFSLEVIRGPASVTYGSNAVHGVINIISPDAFSSPSLNMSIEAGPHDYLRGKFAVSKTLQQHAIAFYGNASSDGGYKQDSGYGQQKFDLIHQYDGERIEIKNVLSVTNLNQETAGFITGFQAYKDKELKQFNPNPEAYRDSKSARAYSKMSFELSNSATLQIKPFVRWTDMQFLQHFLPWQPVEENGQRGFGVQTEFQKQYENTTLVSGFDVDITTGDLQETQFQPFAPTLPEGNHYDYSVNARVYSPFLQFATTLTERVKISGGARYEHTDYDYTNHLSDGDACAPGISDCRFTRPSDQTVNFKQWSFQLGAQYLLNKNNRLYGQVSNGFRAPQATELFRLQGGQVIADLDAEKMDSIEVGLRGNAFSLSYDITLFSMQKSNFIFQDSQRQNVSNGETTHKGIEFSVRAKLPHNQYVTASGSFAKHQYDNELTLSNVSILGNEIDTAPQHQGALQYGWLGDSGHQVELELVHVGNYYLDPANTAEYTGHNLINLRAKVPLTNTSSLSLRLINLADEDYAERADFGFGSYRYFVGEPRSIFVNFRYQLD